MRDQIMRQAPRLTANRVTRSLQSENFRKQGITVVGKLNGTTSVRSKLS